MIVKMKKFTFVLYHLDYEAFLDDLQKLGLVHLIKAKMAQSDSIKANRDLIDEYAEAMKFMTKLAPQDATVITTNLLPKMLLRQVNDARTKKDSLLRKKESLSRQLSELIPWGHFDPSTIAKLKSEGIDTAFYVCSRSQFKQDWKSKYPTTVIAEEAGLIYFVVLYQSDTKPAIDADAFMLPSYTLRDLEQEMKSLLEEIQSIDQYMLDYAKTTADIFGTEIKRLSSELEFEEAIITADREAEDHVIVLSGWIPKEKESSLIQFLNEEQVIYFAFEPTENDDVPVLLKNSAFAKLYEPIAKLFMLPKYNDLDLTPFFAPFFMLFFGFCNADIGYGIILIIFAQLLKRKIKDEGTKSYMNLITLFGISTIVMGWAMGSFFAFDLKENAIIGGSIPIRDTNQIFNFALILGVIQILFGILVNAGKQMQQSGFRYGLASIGTFLFLLSAVIMGSTVMGANPGVLALYAKYPMYLGLALVFLFNSPGKNIIINILSGIWLMYNILTGFFGDLLSYIRLFALGVSSAILGIVVNAMAEQFSGIPVLGPVLFLVFMVFGHTLNLALGALSGFVHPLRLTFVEFYKNAGFTGPGPQYKPFGKHNQ